MGGQRGVAFETANKQTRGRRAGGQGRLKLWLPRQATLCWAQGSTNGPCSFPSPSLANSIHTTPLLHKPQSLCQSLSLFLLQPQPQYCINSTASPPRTQLYRPNLTTNTTTNQHLHHLQHALHCRPCCPRRRWRPGPGPHLPDLRRSDPGVYFCLNIRLYQVTDHCIQAPPATGIASSVSSAISSISASASSAVGSASSGVAPITSGGKLTLSLPFVQQHLTLNPVLPSVTPAPLPSAINVTSAISSIISSASEGYSNATSSIGSITSSLASSASGAASSASSAASSAASASASAPPANNDATVAMGSFGAFAVAALAFLA